MVTARSLLGAGRVRSAAGAPRSPWPRLLWLGGLLLALLYSHGLGVEGGQGHLDPGSSTFAATADSVPGATVPGATVPGDGEGAYGGGAHHEHESETPVHSGGACLSGQPQDGPFVAEPGPAHWDAVPTDCAPAGLVPGGQWRTGASADGTRAEDGVRPSGNLRV
ncbi:hypothetical protein [Streptomyces sp. NPDC047928]|uniref:hypothetical protein n=1 Tax=unclassified Streptomyces TaxID=2593676 RepID=UPI0037104E6A